jgi:hypothetical protein
MTPVPPEQLEAKVPPATAHAEAMEQELDKAVIDHQVAANELREADAAVARASARDEEIQRTYPYGSDERQKAYEEWLAASREMRAKAELLDAAAKQLRVAQYEADRSRYGAAWLRRLAEANRAAYQAAQARNDAATAWERTGMTDYDSPEYARFRDASERFRAAQRELSDRFWNQESPARGTDNTVPAPPQPSMPPTERAPAPGPGAPGGAAAPGGCGGGGAAPAASPAAESVVGVVGAGAGGGN